MVTLVENGNYLEVQNYKGGHSVYVSIATGSFDVDDETFELFTTDSTKRFNIGEYTNVVGYASKQSLIDYLVTLFPKVGKVIISDENGNFINQENPLFTSLAKNDLGYDAWGRPKVVIDNSIFHGMFTYNVPVTTWLEKNNGVVVPFTRATSVNGALNLTSGPTLNDSAELRTFRNPRYEPNRGHLYSTALFLPNPNAAGGRSWGYFTAQSGAFFSLVNSILFAVVRTTLDGVTTDDSYVIDTTGIDLSKGNTYDIQMQWRGVGSYFFYINLNIVKSIDYLGTLTNLSTFNPANPLCFQSINLGDEVLIKVGCVDITSEGGKKNGKTYGSVSISNQEGEVAITGYNVPIIAIRSKDTVNGLINTRDTLALLASAAADQRAQFRVWATRDFTAITENDQGWKDFGDGHLEYIEQDNPDVINPMTFDTSKASLIFGCRVAQDETYATSALFEGRADIYLTPHDMFIFTMHRENGLAVNAGVTFEFAEEI